jgi:hypothetical protein
MLPRAVFPQATTIATIARILNKPLFIRDAGASFSKISAAARHVFTDCHDDYKTLNADFLLSP